MKQEYPGDIRPLMQSCARSAQRRHQDLNRISGNLSALKKSLAQTLEKFAVERSARAASVQALRESTMRTLAQDHKKRSLALSSFRSRLAQDRQRVSSGMLKSLSTFRTELGASVANIKAKTRIAKSMRFKTGSFSLERPVQALAAKRAAKASAKHSDKKSEFAASTQDAAKRSGPKSFLDLIEY